MKGDKSNKPVISISQDLLLVKETQNARVFVHQRFFDLVLVKDLLLLRLELWVSPPSS